MALRVLLGVEPGPAALGLALLITYALHSLVWCGAAVAALSLTTSTPATRHGLWKLALLGPCVTAPMAALAPSSLARTLEQHVVSLSHSASLSADAVSTRAFTRFAWTEWLALGLVCAASLGLMRFVVELVWWRRRLRSRTPVRDPRVLRQLRQLGARAGCGAVRLSESAEIKSPLVIGMRELCVPRAILQGLDEAELAAVLGHELAHLERRDGVWFPIAGLLQSVLWMQPLNHWVASHFRATAEQACDDRAIELTGDRMGLARALVHVAEHALAADAEQSALVPTMASTPSLLRSRVQRLVSRPPPPLTAARALERGSVIASVGVCALASLSLSVGVAQSRQVNAEDAARDTLDTLLVRDRELQAQLAQSDSWSVDHRDDRERAAWKSELEQELRHVRAKEVWIEQRSSNEAPR